MELRELKYFLAVAEQQSITRAAELFLQYLRREIAAESGERTDGNGGTEN